VKTRSTNWLWIFFGTLSLIVLAGFPVAYTNAVVRQNPSEGKRRPEGNYDIRVNGKTELVRVLRQSPKVSPADRDRINSMSQSLRSLRSDSSKTKVQFSTTVGSAEVVRSDRGHLTTPSPGRNGFDIVRDYLRDNAALYGLNRRDINELQFLGESVSRASGLRMVRLQQVIDGIPVFQSEMRAVLDRDGRLIRTVGLLVPGVDKSTLSTDNIIKPGQALASALSTVNINLDADSMTETKSDQASHRMEVATSNSQIKGEVGSNLVYFPLAPGVLVPAWSQVAFTSGTGDWYTLVDARTGTLLWRKNIRSHFASTQEARFSVYVRGDGKTPSSPAPHSPTTVNPGDGTQFPEISRTTVNMLAVQNLVASQNGWIPDGGNTTTGNNVDAYLDTNGNNIPDPGLLDNNGRPVGNLDGSSNNRDFLGTGYAYTPAPQGGNPDAGTAPTDTQFRRGAVTQLFYITNWYHDQLYALGFDEAAGNFQTDNFGSGGIGGDAVLAEAQDGSGTNNANFATPPDGMAGRMQMFIFTAPTPDRDGILDPDIVVHELTHGLSNRLIGNANGLIWDIGGGMGEGWSDFYALSLLNGTNSDDPDAKYASGAYATYRLGGLTDNYLYGIRRFPYSTDNSVNPLTWADVDDITFNLAGGIAASPLDFSGAGALEVHNVGEIWALTLWEVRSRIIADPAGANGDVPTGNTTALQIVTDALKMTPINPSFTDARDALLEADFAANAGANERSIWEGFADRGLGYKAVAPLGQAGILGSGGHVGISESFSVPYLDVVNGAADVTVNDSTGNNNGFIDPGEPISITVTLTNPWRSAAQDVASATATLSTSTAQITITDNSSSYGAIPAQGSATGDAFSFDVSTSATCGQSLRFTVTTVSSLGTFSTNFVLRVGQPVGTGAPITYTRTIPGGLAIPDDDFIGVTDTFTITDDFEIADIDFRVDNLTHTFTGDLTVMLKAPNGYGTDLVYLRGLFTGDGNGDNFINTRFSDDATEDLNLSGTADAPFTGTWQPAFNGDIWSLFGIPNLAPDPVGQLSRINGLSTQGDWRVHLTDQAFLDTGQLNSWSIIVTPVAFTCQPFTPVSPFDMCIVDDSSGSSLSFNSTTGDYLYCCSNGFSITGTGRVTKKGNVWTLQQGARETNRRLQATLDASSKKATASLQSPVGQARCSITDRNISNSVCSCAAP